VTRRYVARTPVFGVRGSSLTKTTNRKDRRLPSGSRVEPREVPQTSTAEVCATLRVAQRARAGRPLPTVDSLTAATALAYDLTRVTRNTRDFEGIGATLVSPWNAS
jgi:predicted nucleic acid-binding protein